MRAPLAIFRPPSCACARAFVAWRARDFTSEPAVHVFLMQSDEGGAFVRFIRINAGVRTV
jgi:hypothetical protein